MSVYVLVKVDWSAPGADAVRQVYGPYESEESAKSAQVSLGFGADYGFVVAEVHHPVFSAGDEAYRAAQS